MKQVAIFVGISAIWYLSHEYYPQYFAELDLALIRFFGHATVWFLNLAGFEANFVEGTNMIEIDGKNELNIGEPCNARDLFAFHLFFFVAFHVFFKQIRFLLGGFVLVCSLNILRLFVLSLISAYAQKYFDFNHHVLFPVLVYSALYLLWEKSLDKNTINFGQYLLIISLLSPILLISDSDNRYKIASMLSDFFTQHQIPNLEGGLDTFLLSVFYGVLAWAMLALYFWKNTLVQKQIFWAISAVWLAMLGFTFFYKILNISFLHLISESFILSFFSPYLLLMLFVLGNWQADKMKKQLPTN